MIRRRIGYFCWLLATAALYFFENNTGTRAVLLASILIPLFSVSCAAWTAKKASCRLRMPEKAEKGERLSCGCVLSGPWTRIGCVLSCRVRAEHLMTHETSAWEIDGGGEAAFAVDCVHCGTMIINAEGTAVRDWLGFKSFSCGGSDFHSLMILPDLYPVSVRLSPQLSCVWQEDRPGQPNPSAEEMENSGVRDYVPGDPVQRIHWKLSGKIDRILIREGDRPLAGSLLLLLETAGYGIDPEDMDSAAEALLSVSRELAAEGISHSVCWQDKGSLQWMEVSDGAGFLSVRDALLNAEAAEAGESVGVLFSHAYPEFRVDQAVIFSPRPDTDAVSMWELGSVVLALPRPEGGNPDIRVTCISREEPELDL